MIKKLSLLAGVCAMGLMTACSDESTPDPTKAEQCSVGLNEDCLLGAWDALGVVNKQDGSKMEGFDFSANPGKLTFYKDKKTKELLFQYDLPAASKDAGFSDCNPIYGNWSVVGATLQMNSTVGNVCLGSPKKALAATVSVEGAEVKLKFNEMWTYFNHTDDATIRSFGSEIFSISAAAK